MSIGYACLTVGVSGTKLRSCTLKNATPDVLSTLIRSNLAALGNQLDYNIQNGIKLFRVSSDIIPFGSHPVNDLRWWDEFSHQLEGIGNKALVNGIRLSMHPGQYTVLNSPNEAVVERAVEDLKYHGRFLDTLGLGKEHKIVLHIGGLYGNKTAALQRFTENFRCLDDDIRHRLVIENDDRYYTISDVLSIGENESIPVVFDNLHHQVNPDNTYSERDWMAACANTWKRADGPPKLHYSQQDTHKRPGSHSVTLDVEDFIKFYKRIPQKNVDIMVEVKDKNLSALKCINAIASPKIQRLEKEWERYKYLVLEHCPAVYQEIRQLLKNKSSYPVVEFYRLIDGARLSPVEPGNAVNAAQHLWGHYYKDSTDENTKLRFAKHIDKISKGGSTIPLKRLLWKLAEADKQKHLLDSLYFMELF
ncbi:MAG: UV DNA damage repair endonuclease UvsE [Syntrophomonadaceae bacterium]|jgi:UV DNA damage endonuclease|nr:UV DNA damage repair endonuclease UvsE [Bacillota bacterium]